RRLIERHTLNLFLGERADEEVVFPRRKLVSRIEEDAGRADRRHPEHSRVLHLRPKPRFRRDESPGVVASHRYERPAIVLAGSEYVHLVATHRADLGLPQDTGFGVKGQSIRVAMSVGIDLRLGAGPADKRIVGRNAAIVTQAQYLSDMVAEVLGF